MEQFYHNCVFVNESNAPLDDFARKVEDGTRYLINKYKHIIQHMKILELGARYGTVSVCLDYISDDPINKVVCVDPDPRVKECLLHNKTANNCNFNIFNGAISNKELYVCHNNCVWETKTYVDPPSWLSCQKIETKTIDELEQLYNIDFDCLLADCEGFLLQFIQENTAFFNKLKCVIYEQDCDRHHPINGTFIDYDIIEMFLMENGFELVEVYIDFIGLYNKIWIKPEYIV